jgi:hypothetical protein
VLVGHGALNYANHKGYTKLKIPGAGGLIDKRYLYVFKGVAHGVHQLGWIQGANESTFEEHGDNKWKTPRAILCRPAPSSMNTGVAGPDPSLLQTRPMNLRSFDDLLFQLMNAPDFPAPNATYSNVDFIAYGSKDTPPIDTPVLAPNNNGDPDTANNVSADGDNGDTYQDGVQSPQHRRFARRSGGPIFESRITGL